MAVETAADRRAFLSIEEFGTTVTAYPGTYVARSFPAIFDREHVLIEAGQGAPVATVEPVLTMTGEDADGLVQGERLRIDGVDYTIADLEPDGTGLVVARLHRE